MKLQISEKYMPSDKPIFMVHNFTDQRHKIEVKTGYGKFEMVHENKTFLGDFDPDFDEYVTG